MRRGVRHGAVILAGVLGVALALLRAPAGAQNVDEPGPSEATVPGLVPGLLPVPPRPPAGTAPDTASGPPTASASGAASVSGAGADSVSPVIFPDQSLPLRFSHARHLRLPAAPACTTCHAAARTSRSSLDNLIPDEAACRACHAIDRATLAVPAPPTAPTPAAAMPPAGCVTCHPGYRAGDRLVARVRIPAPNIKFDHQAHAERGIDCARCHGDLTGVDLATRAQLPGMRLCLACHDGRRAPSTCTTCHLADAGGRVRTVYASGPLAPSGALRGDAHGMGFRTGHAAVAQNSADYCGSCHRQRFCVDCHQGVVKPMDFHGGNYVALHAMDARRNSPDCTTCHRQQSFCTGCHARSGVSGDGRGGAAYDSQDPTRRFHPPGWAAADMGGPGHHGFEARRNIRQCASCHREQFCVTCHTAEPGSTSVVSPHPPGWATSARCRALVARNPRVCLRCHVTPDEARCAR